MEQVVSNLKYILLGLYLLFILRFLLLSFKAYSNILLYECEHLPEQWERDGKPRGIEFWKFPKLAWRDMLYKSALFRSAAISPMLWIFVNPEWTESHDEVLKYFGDLRKNVLWWNIGFLFFICLIGITLNL
jgi:hypothetical protein